MIVIVDSGGANLVSISAALARLGVEAIVTAAKVDILRASHVILPGVGSAARIMQNLYAYDLVATLKALTTPVLGICVGMQILFDFSEEGATPCLGILKGVVAKLPVIANQSLPHMGWNTLKIEASSMLMQKVEDQAWVYFVHNFAAPIANYTIAQTDYGISFSAAVTERNFMGVQFHPERSGATGQQILKNFLELSL